jgi:predicted permease
VEGYTAKSLRDTLVAFNSVSAGYFETMGTPLVAGRDFNDHDTPQAPHVAIVNEAFAQKYFSGANPIGKRYRWNSELVEIIGVVRNAKYNSLRETVPPTSFRSESQEKPRGFAIIEVRASTAIIPAVKAALESVNPDIALQFSTLSTQVGESLTREKLLGTLSGFFGVLALLLAMIGLYGVMSYNVARRRNEIGIRMALGAAQSRVLGMVLSEVATLIGIGVVIGLAAAIGTSRFLESFLYGVKPNDPWTLALAAVVLGAVAAMAGFLPARRASKLDPMTALREE